MGEENLQSPDYDRKLHHMVISRPYLHLSWSIELQLGATSHPLHKQINCSSSDEKEFHVPQNMANLNNHIRTQIADDRWFFFRGLLKSMLQLQPQSKTLRFGCHGIRLQRSRDGFLRLAVRWCCLGVGVCVLVLARDLTVRGVLKPSLNIYTYAVHPL